MASSSKKKTQLQPVKVHLRIRPFNGNEGGPGIQSCTTKEITMKGHSKKFAFDQIFDSTTSQLTVYKSVVGRFVPDVMKGYNCTVFAYGQTGTGKTFTMVGEEPSAQDPFEWTEDNNVGCIVRAGMQLYEELLKLDEKVQHTVTVSFMEIYNEEIRDLLSEREFTPPLRIYEDKNKIPRVKDLIERTVLGPRDIFNLLRKGCEKRQTASTLMNINSSRSHTVFTINVSTMQSVVLGNESITCGKLNLVDLAGSENIGKSGAKDTRAREAGNINQSLLTLGRVMKSLVDNASHIPYRESKLTRILQDSLGGKTKTSIIATISPGMFSLEETMSTLDYAHGARNITNCPQINVKTSSMMADLNEELLRLRRDLFATANEHGVYMDKENYEEMTKSLELSKKEIRDKHEAIQALTEQLDNIQSQKKEWDALKKSFQVTKQAVETYRKEVEHKEGIIQQERYLSQYYEKQGSEMTKTAASLKNLADVLTQREGQLHNKVHKLYTTSSTNELVVKQMVSETKKTFSVIETLNKNHVTEVNQHLTTLRATSDKVLRMHEHVKKELMDNSVALEEQLKNIEHIDPKVQDPLLIVLNKVGQHKKSTVENCETFKLDSDAVQIDATLCKKKVLERIAFKLDESYNMSNKYVEDMSQNIIKMNQKKQGDLEGCFEEIISMMQDTKHADLELKKRLEEERSNNMVIRQSIVSLLNMQDQSDQRISSIMKDLDDKQKVTDMKIQIIKSKYQDFCKWDPNKPVEDFKNKMSNVQKLDAIKHELVSGVDKVCTTTDSQFNHLKNTVETFMNTEESVCEDITKLVCNKLSQTASEKEEMAGVIEQIVNIQVVELSEQFRELEECTGETHDQLEQTISSAQQAVVEYFTKEIVPVQHEGDTPKRQEYDYPRSIVSCKSRESLLHRMAECEEPSGSGSLALSSASESSDTPRSGDSVEANGESFKSARSSKIGGKNPP